MELGCVKALTVLSSQESEDGGIVAVVTGSLEPANKKGENGVRRFMQTFFLIKERN